MVIFYRELARNRKSFLIWIISLAGASVLMTLLFPYMDLKMDAVGDMLMQMPKGMISALNLGDMDFSKIMPFFAYIFQYILLFSAIYAMQFGAGILSKEESEKTIEFLLAKPVKRSSIITSKMLCLLFYIILFNIIFALADYAAFKVVTDQSFGIKAFIMLHVGQLLMQLFFAAVGLFISVFVVKASVIFPLSAGVVLGMYFVNIVSSISEKLDGLKYFTPFKYIVPTDIIKTGGIRTAYLIIIFTVIILTAAGTYMFYNKKNIFV